MAPRPPNEEERLAALQAYAILDTEPEDAFDDLVLVAAEVCQTPTALITLLDEDRQWFKARHGLAATETTRDEAFCSHTILGPEPLVVSDATTDPRFRDNPLVVGDPGIRFYAGSPLTTPDGHRLGALCVIDSAPRPRESLTPSQLQVLDALARQAVRMMEHRRVSAQLADALSRVRILGDLVPICAWCHKLRDDQDFWLTVDRYLHQQAGVLASHGICPTCAERHGGEHALPR